MIRHEYTSQVREDIAKRDFAYFLDKNISENRYSEESLTILLEARNKAKRDLLIQVQRNKKQALFFLDGEVRKMVHGGMLPAHFNMADHLKFSITDFESYGNDWALFEIWQKYEKKKIRYRKSWDITIKVGSVLGIILSLIKVFEVFFHK